MRQIADWISGWTVGGLMALAGVPTVVAALPPAPQGVHVTTQYGIEFSTVDHPGNRATVASEVPLRPELQVGAVDYSFRISRTEVTVSQMATFAQQYLHWNPQAAGTGELLTYYTPRPDGTLTFGAGAANVPNLLSWRIAARYCNWLHNGQVNEAWAFEKGAYDTSSFTTNPDGSFNDQRNHSPNALFWIPTYDEWTKAAYYDPNRYGQGQDGYWMSPNGSNDTLISGLPQDGGQTNAGLTIPQEYDPMPAGSYPGVMGPWGLLDVSGGEREWIDGSFGLDGGTRLAIGSKIRTDIYPFYDRIDGINIGISTTFASSGLRLASVVPNMPSASLLYVVTFYIFQRRRK